MKSLCVLIPCLNEQDSISFCIEKVKKVFDKANIEKTEIIVIDNNSTDKTAEIALKQTSLEHLWTGENLNMINNESLNERDYGDLVGLNKKETAEKFGKEQVHIWRRSYDTPPPNGESLKDVVERVGPYYEQNIQPLINEKKNVIIVAPGNSLRATMIQVGLYKPEEISDIELPTGRPFCIVFTDNKLEDSFYLS